MLKNLKPKSIRSKTRTSLALMFLGLILVICFVLNSVMSNSIGVLEERYAAEHVQRAENAVNQKIAALAQIVNDWALWDDTYQFVTDKNEKYIVNNLNLGTFTNLNLNVMIFINKDGQYVYSGGANLNTKEAAAVSPNLIKYLNNSPIIKNHDPGYTVKGLIMLPEGPMLIAAGPILTSKREGPVRGNFLVGRYLDHSEVSLLSEALNLSLALKKPEAAATNGKSVIIHAVDSDTIEGSAVLKDISGNPAVALRVKMGRDVSKTGREAILWVLYCLTVASLILTAFMLAFLEKNILLRLLKLSRGIKEIGKKKDFSLRLKQGKSQDELAEVSTEINSMLDELEKSQLKIKENEEALQLANENLEKTVQQRTVELSMANESLHAEMVEREKIQEKIKHLAYHDYLTDLPNRLLLNELLVHAIHLAKRSGKLFALLFLDLDGFKMINDTMGHTTGDQLLIEVSNRMVDSLRKSDIVARIGGDEFIILAENIDDVDAVKTIAEKVLQCFFDPFSLNGQDCFITTCIGISIYPSDGQDGETLIKNADIAMYKAKEKGKSQYVFCTPGMKTSVIETMKMTNKLYRALERNEFELYYQPQISCHTNQVVGMEALIRWNHPEKGLISPGSFIHITEQTGLIIPIGEWVLRVACQQNKIWQNAGLPKIRMGVNLSVIQFQSPSFVDQVAGILKETGLDSSYLELEITEGIAMKEHEYIIDALKSLKEMGINIAIDDFGTEYSSLNYLKHLPIDRIKIAMPFVQGIDVSEKDEAITKTIIVLAKSMGLNVIAEGVETEAQLTFLSSRMCDEVQGFYYSKPLPAKEMELLLENQVFG